ncbi:MAG: lipocalin family protein [Ferruginibacter sp.]
MKKISILILLSAILFASCSVSKVARQYKSNINGTWILESAIAEDIQGTIKANIFNEASLNCFIGSMWTFNKGNSLGSYTINKNGGECVAIQRDIRWSIYEAKDEPILFQFKRLDSKLKEMDEGAGFRFTIVESTPTTMSLRNIVTFEGKSASFLYKFSKK